MQEGCRGQQCQSVTLGAVEKPYALVKVILSLLWSESPVCSNTLVVKYVNMINHIIEPTHCGL